MRKKSKLNSIMLRHDTGNLSYSQYFYDHVYKTMDLIKQNIDH